MTKWMMEASIDGIGKHHLTSIFPISIFQYKPGVNANPEDPNYDLKRLALESMSKRIYPNWANCNWSQANETEGDPDTFFGTMGCVDGQEVIAYKFNGRLYVESFSRAWSRLSEYFPTEHYLHPENPNLYMDLKGVEIYDTKVGFTNVKRMLRNKSTDWVDLHLSNGRRLLCTADHPIDTGRGVVPAAQLSQGDSVQIGLGCATQTTLQFDVDKAWFLGFMLCDGCYSSGATLASIAATGEDDIARKFVECVDKFYGLHTTTIRHQARDARGNYKDVIVMSDGARGVARRLPTYFITKFGGVAKHTRQIPNEVFEWDASARYAFLAGMIDADGYVNNTAESAPAHIQIGSTNKELAIQQMYLAQSLGMPARIYHNHYNSKKPDAIRYRVEFYPDARLISCMVCEKKRQKFVGDSAPAMSDTATVVGTTKLTRSAYSYDVETDSEHFEVSGIYSHNCRTLVGFDRHGMGYTRVGRGNNVPNTIILPKLGIEYGVCLGTRPQPDLDGFWRAFEDTLCLCERTLLERYEIMRRQPTAAAPFMYDNGTIRNSEKCDGVVEEAIKHNTLAIGYLGVAEMCSALFGKNHVHDPAIHEFALSVVRRINEFAKEASDRNDLNFSCYAAPAESLCHTAVKALREQYGIIADVTDHEYLTNSHHVPVWEKVSIYEKLRLEAPFCKYPTGGCITYVELESTFMQNLKAVEDIIDYAFNELDIPYLAFNFPIDSCLSCGYQSEFNDACPVCGGTNIQQLRRVTGYL